MHSLRVKPWLSTLSDSQDWYTASVLPVPEPVITRVNKALWEFFGLVKHSKLSVTLFLGHRVSVIHSFTMLSNAIIFRLIQKIDFKLLFLCSKVVAENWPTGFFHCSVGVFHDFTIYNMHRMILFSLHFCCDQLGSDVFIYSRLLNMWS